eukprot:Hpha_TRINITY_DN34554_c0_g1::TRINITY_DN34554_c0_g1_i1::g.96272::m.96272
MPLGRRPNALTKFSGLNAADGRAARALREAAISWNQGPKTDLRKGQQARELLGLLDAFERAGMKLGVRPYTSVVSSLGRLNKGYSRMAQEVFDRMCRRSVYPDGACYTALLTAHAGARDAGSFWDAWRQMKAEGQGPKAGDWVACLILARWMKWGDARVQELLRTMDESFVKPDIVHYGAAIAATSTLEGAESLITDMEGKKLMPNYQCFLGVLQRAAREGNVDKAREVVKSIEGLAG